VVPVVVVPVVGFGSAVSLSLALPPSVRVPCVVWVVWVDCEVLVSLSLPALSLPVLTVVSPGSLAQPVSPMPSTAPSTSAGIIGAERSGAAQKKQVATSPRM
jgi:hypothetical protein